MMQNIFNTLLRESRSTKGMLVQKILVMVPLWCQATAPFESRVGVVLYQYNFMLGERQHSIQACPMQCLHFFFKKLHSRQVLTILTYSAIHMRQFKLYSLYPHSSEYQEYGILNYLLAAISNYSKTCFICYRLCCCTLFYILKCMTF